MNRLNQNHLLTYAFALLLCCRVAAAESGRPNFLVIMADDCTFNDLSIYSESSLH